METIYAEALKGIMFQLVFFVLCFETCALGVRLVRQLFS
jgi:hypothetical protein